MDATGKVVRVRRAPPRLPYEVQDFAVSDKPEAYERRRRGRQPGTRLGRRPGNQARDAAILKAVVAGQRVMDIAKQHGVSDDRVYEIARTAGKRCGHRETSHETREKIIAAFKAGRLVREIAAELGVKKCTAYSALEREGLKRADYPVKPDRAAPRDDDDASAA
jgi:transposase